MKNPKTILKNLATFVNIGILTFFTLLLSPEVSAAPDTTPPNLISFSITPQNVDVTASPAALMATVHVMDSESYVTYIGVSIISPYGFGGQQSGCIPPLSPTNDITCATYLTLAKGAQAGNWKLKVTAYDAAGNTIDFDYAYLASHGFSSSVGVTSNNTVDTTPPEIVGLSFFSSPIHTGTILGSARFTDDISGVKLTNIHLRNPSNTGGYSVACEPQGDYLPLNDYSCIIAVTPLDQVPVGTWSVTGASAMDTFGNFKQFSQSDLAARGLPTSFTVN